MSSRRILQAFSSLAPLALSSLAVAQQLPSDNFNDGMVGPLWTKETAYFHPNLSVIERNQRLEGVVASDPQPIEPLAVSGYASKGWQLRSDAPFRIRFSFRQLSATGDVRSIPEGAFAGLFFQAFASGYPSDFVTGLRPGVGLALGTLGRAPNPFGDPPGTFRNFLTFSADETTVYTGEFIAQESAYAVLSAQSTWRWAEDDLPAPSIPTQGTIYLQYLPEFDLITVGTAGYVADPDSPNAYRIAGVRGGSSAPLQFAIGVVASSANVLSGANSWLDDFAVEEGVLETAVGGLAASDGTSPTEVRLTWTAATGATALEVQRIELDTGLEETLALLASDAVGFVDRSAEPGRLYVYRVSTNTGLAASDTGWAFGPPSNVRATDGILSNGVRIAWDMLPGATSYRIFRAAEGSPPVAIGSATSSPYLDTTAATGVVYGYSVATVKGTNESAPGQPDPGYRGSVGPGTTQATDGTLPDGIRLTWSAVPNATSYEIYTGDVPDKLVSLAEVPATETSFLDVLAWQGYPWLYAVRAIVNGEPTAFGPTDSGWWLQAPGSFRASDGEYEGAVELLWERNFAGSGYEIYRGGANSTPTTLIATIGDPSVYFFNDNTAVAGQVYSYRIRTTSPVGDSAFSPTDTGRVGVGGGPSSVYASDGLSATGVLVEWEPNPFEYPISGYRVYRQQGTATPVLLATLGTSVLSYNDATAVPGTLYTYEVRARYASGLESTGNRTDTGWRSIAAPTGLAATSGTRSDGVNLTWNAVTGALGYRIFRTNASGNFAAIGTTTSASYLDGSAPLGIPQTYRISAIAQSGDSAPTSPVTGWRTISAPSSVVASDGGSTGGIEVTWNPVSSSSVSGYLVFRSTGGASNPVQIADLSDSGQESYLDVHDPPGNNLVAGTIYTYQLKTKSAFGPSPASASDTGWRNLPAPANVVATDGALTTGVRIEWAAVSGATGYRVLRGTSADSLVSIATPTASPYTDTTAVAGTSYLYAVAARTATGDSPRGGPDAGWRNIGPPTAVLATDGTLTTGVNVTWTAATGAASYRIYRAPSSAPANPVQIGTSASSPFLDASADVGIQYAYTVRSITPSGESGPSNVDNGWRTIVAPTGVVATDGTSIDAVTISWSPVPGATGYRVYRAVGAGTPAEISPTASFTDTTFIDATAVRGTLYSYSVRTRTGPGNSPPSVADSGWRNVAAPASLAATDGSSATQVTVTWPAVAGATGYSVYRRIGDGPVGPAVASSGTTFNDTTAAVGTLYTYLVKARTAAGESTASPEDTGWRNAAAPAGLLASDGTSAGSVTVSWNNVPGAIGYEIVRTRGTTEQLFLFPGSPFSDSLADPAIVYSYKVRAVTGAGPSPYSGSDTGYRNLPAPTGVAATDGVAANISVTWNPVDGAAGYRLYRAIGSAAPTEITPAAGFTATSFTDTTAVNGTVYTYSVRARVALSNGQSANSLPSAADTGFRTMPAPTGVAASDGTSPAGVIVTWNPIPAVSAYRIYRSQGSATPNQVGTVDSGASFTDISALVGTTYSYTVRGVFNGIESPASTANTGWRTLPAPASILASDGTSVANVAISWTPVESTPALTAYRVYRKAGNAAPAAIHTTANSSITSFNDTTAVAGTPYTYSVRSVLSLGESADNPTDGGWRNVAGPATLAATDGTVTTGVNLTWPAVSGANGYRILRGALPDGSDLAQIAQVAGVTAFQDVAAASGVTYQYRIAPTTAAGPSTSTSPINPGWRNVAAPSSFTAGDGSSTSGVNLSWTPVDGASSYLLERGIGSAFTPLPEATGTEFTDSTAASGTVYTYRIRPKTPSGNSLATKTDTGWRTLPAPQGVAASDGSSTTSVTVGWNSIGNGVPGHTGYRVYRSTAGSTFTPVGTVAAGVTSFTDTTAIGGKLYTYAVRSSTAAGESANSPTDTGWRNVLAPANLQATDGTRTDGVNLTWSAVTGAASYRVLRGTGPSDGTEIGSVVTTGFLDTTAQPGITFHYSVKAMTEGGSSAASAVNTGWRNVPAPTGLLASDGDTIDAIELEWTKVEGATGYEIYRAAGSAVPTGAPIKIISDPMETSYEDVHLVPANTLPAGSLFNYVVKAKTASGLSAASTANTGWRNIPSPAYLSATEGTSLVNVSLEWASIGSGVQGHTGYRVYRRTGTAAPVLLATVPVTATAYVDATAAAGVPYDYSVASVTAAGNSQNAPEAFGFRNVPAPTGLVASDDLPTQIRISWLPVNDPAVIGYRVYIRFPWLGFTSELGTVPAATTVYTVSNAGFYNNAEYAVQAMTLAGGSDASNWDVGSYGGSMMAMTASPPAGLPDGRIGGSVPDGTNRVPTGKNGDVPIGNPLSTDASAGSGSTDIDRTVASERSCAEIVTRIEALIAVSADDDRSLDETVRAGIARLLIQDPNDPSLRIPACAMHEGDVNLDGSVDEIDLAAFLAAWADWDLVQGDLDRDGTIDDRDLDVIGRRLVRAAVGEEEPTSAE